VVAADRPPIPIQFSVELPIVVLGKMLGGGTLAVDATWNRGRASSQAALRLFMRYLYNDRVAHFVAAVTGAYSVYYLVWRATETLNREALLFSLVFLAAELHGVVTFFLFALMTWNLNRGFPFRLRPDLKVDVFVPTYDEDLDVLEPTLIGCRAIRYPHTTYVLDDGRRPEVKALAERLECIYLTRPDNAHAKAGNLNAALAQTDGDFIVVLDADMVPQPEILHRTLGYFVDERVALVQLPQEFYNLDSMQHLSARRAERVWHDQSVFFHLIQPGKNRWGAAFWCGSPSVVRRAALLDVGGVATETVTEDIQTSVRLHARGWKTIFLDEVQAFGIAPGSLHAFCVQRMRWAQGAMQLLRTRDNPLFMPGLSLAQRANYWASISTYFDAYQKLVFLLTPIVILSTGALPISVDALEFMSRWLPFFLLGVIANLSLGRGHFRYLEVELLNLFKIFIFLRASLTLLFPKGLNFRVTPKRAGPSAKKEDTNHLYPHLALLGLTFLGMILGIANLVWGITASFSHREIAWFTLFWSLVNGGVLALGVWSVRRRPYNRQSYRFPSRLLAVVKAGQASTAATVEDLSPRGAGLALKRGFGGAPGEAVQLKIFLSTGLVTAETEVAHVTPLGDGGSRVGLKFTCLGSEARERLISYLFVTLARYQWETAEGRGAHLPMGRPRRTGLAMETAEPALPPPARLPNSLPRPLIDGGDR
jgi:cellulose synthase (UDP-forming)